MPGRQVAKLTGMNKNKLCWLAALASTCALMATAGEQAHWKWRDANGHIQYSDLPPPKTVAPKDILIRPMPAPPSLVPAASAASAPAASAAASEVAPAVSDVDPALEAKRKQAEQEETAKRKAEETRIAQARAQSCERARAALRTLESGVRIARTNVKGEREFLDDGGREQETQVARGIVASDCR